MVQSQSEIAQALQQAPSEDASWQRVAIQGIVVLTAQSSDADSSRCCQVGELRPLPILTFESNVKYLTGRAVGFT